ncbi:MBL fold metallo-hydrolase [Nocardia australiensis]|uniref:MBL fold metallo-hydrolase n=1 Tax=Nocardia australiensis TaxID=2887191 RepID=UPI001D13D1A2|nr:MBL fold metallo-hydrolase [Nocardia australiensis]
MTMHDKKVDHISHGYSRRSAFALFGTGLATLAATSCAAHATSSDEHYDSPLPPDAYELTGSVEGYNTKLILLGTAAGPLTVPGRSGTATVLMVGDRPYLIDAGPASSRKLGQAGISAADLGGVFITHMHNDHIADLFNIFWLPGVTLAYKFTQTVPIFGPGSAGALPIPYQGGSIPIQSPSRPTPGITEMLSGLRDAYAYEINIRNTEKAAQADFGQYISAHDILPPPSAGASFDNTAPTMEPFTVFEDDLVRVTAILVPHGPVFPSYAFRFDTDDGAVTFSGDTAKSDNVIRLAAGTDILVHEVVDIDYYARTMKSPAMIEHMVETHTIAADVGRVASAAGAKHVVLSHIGPGDPREVDDDQWERGVRSTFTGPITVGHDLVQIAVGRRSGP